MFFVNQIFVDLRIFVLLSEYMGENMKFSLWTLSHLFYALSPFIVFTIIYYIMRNQSFKSIYIVGVIIGSITLGILVFRNIYIFIKDGFSMDLIPLQACHLGSIAVFITLVFRNNVIGSFAWCFTVITAYFSVILPYSLAEYESIFNPLSLVYLFGHLITIVGAIYAVVFEIIVIDKKIFRSSLMLTFVYLFACIIINSLFINVFDMFANYLFTNASGTAIFDNMFNIKLSMSFIDIYPIYLFSVTIAVLLLYIGFYYLYLFLYKKNVFIQKSDNKYSSEYNTKNILYTKN